MSVRGQNTGCGVRPGTGLQGRAELSREEDERLPSQWSKK